ncbi:hypothetical protein HDU87_004277 [Geranomyces variabilis]|uniref:Uncharacterized protein n=1 Tax=Geranomyces variabilis TaxID=109894 RepID=A0AAD5TIV9_9FUNG|nr:hypothetical protein HDU87_004277 [Geranomyces variabilis]
MALFGRRPARTTLSGSLKSGRRRRNQRRAAVLILFALSILFLETRYRNRQEEEHEPLSTPLTPIPAPEGSSRPASGAQRQETLQNAVDHNAAASLASVYPKVIRRALDIPVTKFVLPAVCRAQQAGFQGVGGLQSWGELFTAFWIRNLPAAAATNESTAGLTHLLQISRRELTWDGGGDTFSVVVRGDTSDGKRVTLAPRRRWDFNDGTYVFGFTVLDTAKYQVNIALLHTRYGAFVAPDAGDQHTLTGEFHALGSDAQCPPPVIGVKIETSRMTEGQRRSAGMMVPRRGGGLMIVGNRGHAGTRGYLQTSSGPVRAGETASSCEVADILKGMLHDREDEKLLTTIRKDNVLVAYHPWDVTTPEQLEAHLATAVAGSGQTIVVFNTDLVHRLAPAAYVAAMKAALHARSAYPTIRFVFANGVATQKVVPFPPPIVSDGVGEEDHCSNGCGLDRYATAERVAQYARIGTHIVERDSPRAVQILDLFAMSEPRPASLGRSHPGVAIAEAANVVLNMACS